MAFSFRRPLRYAAGTTVVLAAIGVASSLFLPSVIQQFATEQIAAHTGRQAAIGEVSINPLTLTITVRDVTLYEADGTTPAFQANALVASASIASLFNLAPVLDEITIDTPTLKLARLATGMPGETNFSDIVTRLQANSSQADPADSKPLAFALSDIRLINGAIDIDDRITGKHTQIDSLNIRVPYFSTFKRKVNTDITPYLSAVVNNTPFLLKARSKPFTDNQHTTLALDITHLDLVEYLPYLPVALPVRLDSASISSTLDLNFRVEDGHPRITLGGNLSLSNLSVKDKTGQPLVATPLVSLDIAEVDILSLSGTIRHLIVDRPQIWASMDQSGALNWRKLAGTSTAKQPAPATTTAADSAIPALAVETLAINDGTVYWSDAAHATPKQNVTLSDLDLRAHTLSTNKAAPAGTMTLSLRENNHGTLNASGDLHPALPFFKGQVAASGIRLATYQPYFNSVSAGLFAGNLATSTDLSLDAGIVRIDNTRVNMENLQWSSPSHRSLERIPARERLEASKLAVTLDTLSTAMDQPSTFTVKGTLANNGSIDINGTSTAGFARISLDTDLRQFPVMPFQSYFQQYLNAQLMTGSVSGKTRAHITLPRGKQAFALDLRGNAALNSVVVLEKATNSNFLRWSGLSTEGIRVIVGKGPTDVTLDKITLRNFFARTILSEQGRLNLQDLIVTKSDAAPVAGTGKDTPASTTPPAAAEAAPVIRIGQVVLDRGSVNFTDNFIKPNYRANMTGISGTIGAFASNAQSPAQVNLHGKIDDAAPMQISGAINPLFKPMYLDIKGNANGIELTRLTPYSAKYTGYPITKGKLSWTASYKVEAEQLLANNDVLVDQLTFGEYVAGPDVTKLPVTLAVALLKDRHGQINVGLPISGSLSDPEFSVGGVIFRVFVNLITKAVTSPFALLGSMFGGGEEMAYAEFAPGTATLSEDTRHKLDNLAKALHERPGLNLDITGHTDQRTDISGIAQDNLTRRMRQLKRDELTRKGKEEEARNVTLTEDEIDKYMKVVYREAKFDKPTNMLGLTKSLPRAEMAALLIANTQVSDDDLLRLAQRRAEAVRAYLEKTGEVPAERMFLLAPDTRKEVPADSSMTRVDFSLK